LASISGSTKIALSLLAALERGDVTKWPVGIFRRAFMREYALAAGLPADEYLAEFTRLFPEPGASIPPPARPAARPCGDLRIAFADQFDQSVRPFVFRSAAALADMSAIAFAGTVVAVLGGLQFLTATGICALVYYAMATIVLGSTPGLRFLKGIALPSCPTAASLALARLSRVPGQMGERLRALPLPRHLPRLSPGVNFAALASGAARLFVRKCVTTINDVRTSQRSGLASRSSRKKRSVPRVAGDHGRVPGPAYATGAPDQSVPRSGRPARPADGLVDHLPELRRVQPSELAPER
jgi:hypothetical protein